MSRHRAEPGPTRHARRATTTFGSLLALTIALTERIEDLEHTLDWERRRWDARPADAEAVAT